MANRPNKRHTPRKRPAREREHAAAGLAGAHLETLRDCLRRFLATPLASTMTAMVIAVALLLPALLGLLSDNLSALGDSFRDSARVTLYLHDAVSEAEALELSKDLLTQDGIAAVDYTSRSQALQEFQARSGFASVVAELGDNPLPASLTVTPLDRAPGAVQELVTQLQTLPEVESVMVDQRWMQRLGAMQALTGQLGLLLTLVMGLAVLLIVGNTIRTGIEQRKREIEVIRLVGGTVSYIARPFLYGGLLLGLCGASLACLLIGALQLAIGGPIDNLLSLYGSAFQVRLFTLSDALALLLLGGLLGWLGAAVATLARLYGSPP